MKEKTKTYNVERLSPHETDVRFHQDENTLTVSFRQFSDELKQAFGERGIHFTSFSVNTECELTGWLYFLHHKNQSILPRIADDLVTHKDSKDISEGEKVLIDYAVSGITAIIQPTPEVAADRSRWVPQTPPPNPRGSLELVDIRWYDPVRLRGYTINK